MKKIILNIICFSVLVSCNDYLDINDPSRNNPSSATEAGLLNGAEQTFKNMYYGTSSLGSTYGSINNILKTYVHQINVREDADKYATGVGDANINNAWAAVYADAIPNMDLLISQATANNNMEYAGVGKILKAYMMAEVVDLWGEVPYTEANQLASEGNLNASFDNDKTIYTTLFSLIDEGINDIKNASGSTFVPGSEDLFYGGDLTKWITLANTLKLKMYNNVRLDDSMFDATEVQNLLSGDIISDASEDFQFAYTRLNSPQERHPLYVSDYSGGQNTNYVSPWMYEIMMGVNINGLFSGIKDPRMPYYFYKQLVPGEVPDPGGDYHDISTGFYTIRFASNGPDRDHSNANLATYIGLYPCGGPYDDGSGENAAGKGNGQTYQRMLTLYDRYFIEAELYITSTVSGDARTALESAMRAAFAKVDEVISYNGVGAPKLNSTEVDDYITAVLAEYDSASDEEKLEIIMTQKWLANYGSFTTSYTDYRRTGYPIWPNPNASPEYNLGGIDDSETSLAREYPLSIYWPSSELTPNSNSPDQKIVATYTVFWDK